MAEFSPIEAGKAIQFMGTIGKLKELKRAGWIREGVSLPESVADHMYRMAMCSFMLTDRRLNKDKLIKVCLMHDVAEATVGDITPHDNVSKEEKRRLEETAMREIIQDIGNEGLAGELYSLWLEYEEGTSLEATVARELDKFEMIIQANEYETRQGLELETFFRSTEGYFTHPEIVAWDIALRQSRKLRFERQENK